jgi:signal transduction histidine kinase
VISVVLEFSLMPTTLSRKLLLYIGSMVIALLAITFLVMERNQAQSWEDHLYSQSLSFARLATPELLKRFRGSFPPDEPVEISDMYDFLGLNRDLMQFSLIANSGRRLYVSAVFPAFQTRINELEGFTGDDLAERLDSGRVTMVTRRLPSGRRLLDLLEPAYSPAGQQVLSVRYLISYDSVDSRMTEVRRHFMLVALVAVGGCLVVVGYIARRMARPIEDLTDGARALAKGNLGIRIPLRTRDELGTLAQAFNDMAHSLSRSQAELKAKNQALSQAYQDLSSMQQQLLRSERLAAIGQLAAGVSHEIDNPVGIILGYAELLHADMEENDPRRDDLKAIIDECRRCKRITGGLLGFARPTAGSRDLINFNHLIEETVLSLKPQRLFKELDLHLDLPDDPLTLQGDPDQLRQVLINVLLNAAQAISGSGTVCIRLNAKDDRAVLSVDDNGPGVSSEDFEAVFEPFFSTKAHGEGTGLGLAVCRKLINDHGGDIHITASPLGGARLTIVLPISSRVKKL